MLDLALIQRSPQISHSHNAVIAAIPCFNTQDHILDIVGRTRRYVDKVIVVDDGSADNTAQVAQSAGAIVINHSVNKGYGEAIKSCFKAARAFGAEILVIIDGDGQHNPDEIPSLISPVLKHEADLVIGSRFLTSSHALPGYRSFGINLINFIWNFGSKIKVSDTQSGFRSYSQRVIQSLEVSETGMGVSIEILEKVRRSIPLIKEIPITCSYENNNSSLSFKALRHGINVAFSVLRIRLKDRFNSFKGVLHTRPEGETNGIQSEKRNYREDVR